MAVNRTSTRVLASTFSPGGAKWKSMLTKSCGWYDYRAPEVLCAIRPDLHDLASRLRVDAYRLGRRATHGGYAEFAERPPAVHLVQKYVERFGLAAGNLDGLDDRIQHYVLLFGVMRRTISAP